MNTENGSMLSNQPEGADVTSAIAQTIVSSLRGKVLEPVAAPAPAGQQSFAAFATRLDQLISSNPELKEAVEEALHRSVRQALAFGDGPLQSTAEFLDNLHRPQVAAKGGTYVRWDWWGFQIRVSHEDLSNFLATAVPLSVITASLALALAPTPAAPFIAAIAAFIAGALALLAALDRGRGVDISMSYFAPLAFVPTTI